MGRTKEKSKKSGGGSSSSSKGGSSNSITSNSFFNKISQGLSSFGKKAKKSGTSVVETVEQTGQKVGQTLQEGYEYGSQKVQQGIEFGSQKVQQGIEYGSQKLQQGIEFGSQKLQQGYEYGKDKTLQGIDEVKGIVDSQVAPYSFDETIHSKGGTVKGFDQAESMGTEDSHQSALDRFQELEDLLFRGNARGGPKIRPGTLDLFNKVTTRLAGGGVLKGWGDMQMNGMRLKDALRASFASLNRFTGDYLVDMLVNDGIPSPAMQILDVMGYVSIKQRPGELEYDKLLKSICSDLTPSEAKDAMGKLERRRIIVPKALSKVAKEGEKLAKAGSWAPEEELDWATSWDRKLADGVDESIDKIKMKGNFLHGGKYLNKKKRTLMVVGEVRKKIAKMIEEEIEAGRVGVAQKALRDNHPLFEAALTRNKYVDEQLKQRLIKAATVSPQMELDIQGPEEKISKFETDEQGDKRVRQERKEDSKDIATVSVVRSLLTDNGVNAKELKSSGDPVKHIANMTPEQRMKLVASYLPEKDRKVYLNPATTAALTIKLFEDAWAVHGLRTDLQQALFNQDTRDELKKKEDEGKVDAPHLKKKIVKVHSMLRFSGDPGPNYSALIDLANDKIKTKVSTTTYGTRIWEIAQGMKGVELYQIRNDVPLLLRLRKLVDRDKTRPSATNWDKFIDMFQLPANLKIRGVAKEDKPTLENVQVANTDGFGNGLDGKETMGDTYAAVMNMVEYSPKYWAMHLHRLVKMIKPSKSDTYSVVTRAQMTAKRWVLDRQEVLDKEHQEQVDEANKNGSDPPDAPPKPTQAEFLRQIFDAMAEKDQKSLQKKIPHAFEALANGKELTTDVRLERARGWKFGDTQTSLNTNKGGVVSAWEDLSGKELLEEWSNIAEVRNLNERKAKLQEEQDGLFRYDENERERVEEIDGEIRGLDEQIGRWWPSINRTKLKWIEQNLAGGSRTDALGMLANKLAGAMRSDSEFKEEAKKAGLTADDYDAERLMFGHVMNKRRQLDTGLQYGSTSQLEAFRGLGSLMSPTGGLQFAMKGGNQYINKTGSQQRKAQSNMYLAKVRTTQAEIGKTQSDTSLSKEERQEKLEHIRETSSEDLKDSREELERREKVFGKARSALTKAITKILKAIFVAAVTAATFGQGTVAVIVAMILAGIAKEAAGAVAKWVMMGDAFEHKELAKAVLIGAVKGALRAATMELLTVIDLASSAVDFSPEGLEQAAQQSNFGLLVTNGVVSSAMRSAMVDIPANTMKYFLNAERPFRDFGRGLDTFLAQNLSGVLSRQLAGIGGAVIGQLGEMANQGMGETAGSSGGIGDGAREFFEREGKGSVVRLIQQGERATKYAKIAIKLAVKKLWGKNPERWKSLSNESLIAIQRQRDIEKEIDPWSLPSNQEIERVIGIIDEIVAGTKDIDDVAEEDKAVLGMLIAYGKQNGIQIP